MRLWHALLRLLGLRRPRLRNVLEQVAAPANLAAAWSRVQRRGREAVGGQAELAAFAADSERLLARLRDDLRRGRYRPGAGRRAEIPKADGGTRPLLLLAVPDRVAQTAAGQVLTPLLDAEMSPASFGFRPNRSVADALDRVRELKRSGLAWVVDGDIERCFERVRHDRLLARLEESIADRRLLRLVAAWLAAFADGERGLPQGAPLSPLLCNMALEPFDRGLAKGPGRLVRFADDFVILCRSRGEAERARRRAAELLSRQGLRMHPRKSRVCSFADGFFFLGHYFVHDLMLRDAALDACEDVKRRAEVRAGRARRGRLGRWFRLR